MVTSITVDDIPAPTPGSNDDSSDSSPPSPASTIDRDIRDNMELLMWDKLASPQCSPEVLKKLHNSWLILRTNEEQSLCSTMLMRNQLIEMAMTPPIDRDTFNPLTAETDRQSYLWFTWLTAAQYDYFKLSGKVPGYKETRRDNVHKHHGIHNRPDHCINLAIHTRWNAAADNDNYRSTMPIFLVVWKTSVHNILTTSRRQGNPHSAIHFRRPEDISIEFNPVYNGQDPLPLNLNNMMGQTIGVWNMEHWHRIDTQSSTILWLDHGISAWCATETQWHLNEGFCENNNLSTLLNKYMETDGTLTPQYVTGDTGVEHDHKIAMAPHKWNKGPVQSTMVRQSLCALAHLRTMPQTCSSTVGNDIPELSTPLGQQCAR
eukprot:4482651-Amphidinium_carterae.3